MNKNPAHLIPSPRLWFLTLCYAMILVAANWFDARLVQLFGFTTDAGTLIFPFTFLLSDLITEIYGFKHARRAIWLGLMFALCIVIYGQIVIHLPGPDYASQNAVFDSLVSINTRIIAASIISYLCAEPLNSFLMAKLKIKFQGRWMGSRFILSTFIASGVDSFLFGTLAFYATMTESQLLDLILTMWFFKVFIELCMLPISTRLAQSIKDKERMDIYDIQTQFNIFNFDVSYENKQNFYARLTKKNHN